jgi:hypothetical protein
MVVDILPNLSLPIIVYTTMMIRAPSCSRRRCRSWGWASFHRRRAGAACSPKAAANSLYLVSWWLVLIPGAALLLTTLAFNILGDGLRDALDPRSRSLRGRRRKALP